MRSALAFSVVLATTLVFGSYEASALDLGGRSDSRSDSRSERRGSNSFGGLGNLGRSAIDGTKRAASNLVGSARNTVGVLTGGSDRTRSNQASTPAPLGADRLASGLPLPRARPIVPAALTPAATNLSESLEATVDLGRSADLSSDAIADQWIVQSVASGTPEPILANRSFAPERAVAISRSVPAMRDGSVVREVPGFPFQAPAPVELARAIPAPQPAKPEAVPLLRPVSPAQDDAEAPSPWPLPLLPVALAGLGIAVLYRSQRLREVLAGRMDFKTLPTS